jgi:hypothetical protein
MSIPGASCYHWRRHSGTIRDSRQPNNPTTSKKYIRVTRKGWSDGPSGNQKHMICFVRAKNDGSYQSECSIFILQ